MTMQVVGQQVFHHPLVLHLLKHQYIREIQTRVQHHLRECLQPLAIAVLGPRFAVLVLGIFGSIKVGVKEILDIVGEYTKMTCILGKVTTATAKQQHEKKQQTYHTPKDRAAYALLQLLEFLPSE
jgi:uncharacterized membrane protein